MQSNSHTCLIAINIVRHDTPILVVGSKYAPVWSNSGNYFLPHLQLNMSSTTVSSSCKNSLVNNANGSETEAKLKTRKAHIKITLFMLLVP